MTFEEWLRTATKRDGSLLSASTVKHYLDGFKITSKEMYNNKIIDKRLEDMNMYELELAISLIMIEPSFVAKDKKGNHMYSNSLKRFRCYRYLNTDIGIQEVVEETLVMENENLTKTEKEVIVKARRGQGKFRESLINKYDNRCIMTDISISQVLVASHIKPWVVCNNQERVDVNNGLLLSATYDRLFDSGLITFDINGKIKISSMISKENANKLNLTYGKKYNIKYHPEMNKYIKYHNEIIFVA